jgi:6-phosphogluconolactonase
MRRFAPILPALIATALLAQNVSFHYFYDSNHRLIRVLDSSGNLVEYVYDQDGNPTQITRSVIAANSLTILNIVPQRGIVGQSITIQGQNFGATIAANTVSFNGVQATVTFASSTQLTVTIPTGATTGPVSVTVSGSTAHSSVFTVLISLSSIAVSPSNPSISLGTTQQFIATGTYTDNSTQDLTASASWNSSLPAVATIASGPLTRTPGFATTLSVGSTTISATVSGITGSTLLTVNPPNLVSLAITPSDPQITMGGTLQLSAIGTYTDSSTHDFTTQATWSSSNQNFATVSNLAGSQGLLTAIAAGATTITATLGATTAHTTATVIPLTALQTPRFLYLSNVSDGITVYAVNASTGQVRAISATPPGSQNVTPPVIVGNFLYIPDVAVAQRGVIGYSINPAEGTLTALPGSPFYAGASVTQPLASLNPMVVTPSGAYAFVILPNGTFAPPQVVTMSINSTSGAMAFASTTTIGGAGTTAGSLTMDPRGHFLYVADPNNDVLHVLSINPNTGATTPVTGSPFSFPSIGKIAQIAASPASPFVFVYDQANAQLDGLSVDGVSGMPTLLASGPVAVGPVNMNVYPAMRFDPSGQHLYVGEGSGFEGFAISDTGALTAVPGSPFSLPNGDDFQVSLDPSNQFLYSGYYDFNLETGALASYRIAPSGALTLVSTRTAPSTDEDGGMGFLGGASPLDVAPAFAYTADGTGNDLTLFAVNAASGGLSALSSSPLKGTTTPIAAATDPFGQFVFTLDQGGLEVYTEDPFAGSLTLASGAPYTAGTNPSALAVDPLDRFVFVANQGSNNVSVFQLNSGTGALTTVPGSPFPADAMPSAFAVDPAGQVLLVANAGSAKVSAFHVLLTGALRADAPPFAAGTSPVAVAIDASGHYAYVVNRGSNDISIFSIMPDTDVGGGPGLQSIATLGLPAGTSLPRAAAIDPAGRFLYVAGGPAATPGTVSAYTIDPASGNLTSIAGSPFAAGQAPAAVSVDPSGAFLYVTNSGSGNVSVYAIDSTTGALSPIPAPTYPTGGANPVSMAISPRIH